MEFEVKNCYGLKVTFQTENNILIKKVILTSRNM